jgi:protoheme IX farnesyltransferase
MSISKAITHSNALFAHWRDYYALCKPKVCLLLVFTAMVGMLLSTPGMIALKPFLFGTLGIALAAASAAALNQIIDQRADAIMERTRHRPLVRGALDTAHSLTFALILGVIAMIVLVVYVNTLTAVLTFLSLIGYAVVYTLYLKRATPQNIVIGGVAGAMPPVLGWVAMTGRVDPDALLLFLIIYVWTPPHFWALALHRKDDYASVDIPMLPVTHGAELTRLHILLYTVLLVVVSVLPFVTGMCSSVYLVGALLLGGRFLYHALRLFWRRETAQPIRTFVFSITYLMGLFALLLGDHYVQLILA